MSKSSLVNAIRSLILTLVFILALSLPSWSQHTTWTGKVVGVSDGDTITVMHNGKAEKIRLYGIDCPEKRQAFGKRAKQFTSKMVFGRIVEARPVTTDRYGRTIAWIYVDGECLNEELLKAGLAWLYNKASLHAIDRFFMQVRRRLSLLKRPISSSANLGRRWFGYGPCKPAMVGKLLDIFRVFYNFVEFSDSTASARCKRFLPERKGPLILSQQSFFIFLQHVKRSTCHC
jgi:endonuclease YncB( thermonuclease family)